MRDFCDIVNNIIISCDAYGESSGILPARDDIMPRSSLVIDDFRSGSMIELASMTTGALFSAASTTTARPPRIGYARDAQTFAAILRVAIASYHGYTGMPHTYAANMQRSLMAGALIA